MKGDAPRHAQALEQFPVVLMASDLEGLEKTNAHAQSESALVLREGAFSGRMGTEDGIYGVL